MPSVVQVVLVYAGFGVATWVAFRGGAAAAHRIIAGGWTGWWFASTIDWLALGRTVPLDLSVGLLVGAWAAGAVALRMSFPPTVRRSVLLLAFTAAGLVPAAGALLTLDSFTVFARVSAFGVALFLDTAVLERRFLPWRVILHWARFLGTFALLLPHALPASPRLPTPLSGASLVLLPMGLVTAFAATAAMARTGATPDPLDRPATLCTTGIYAWVRHPIQMAHLCFVLSGALHIGTTSSLIYFLGFAIALLGPFRRREERGLLARFGEAYSLYRTRTPGYVPFMRSVLSRPRRLSRFFP